MAFPSLGDKYLITAYGELCGQTIMNTFWYTLTNVGAFTLVQPLYDAIANVFNAAGGVGDLLLTTWPQNAAYKETWVQRIAPVRVMKNVYTVAEVGSMPEAYTANIQASIERRGEVAVKAAVGAIRIPISGDENTAANGIITSVALKTALANLAGEMKQPLTGGALGGAILRPIVYNPRPNPGALGYEIARTTPMETVRVLRRRTVRVGI